LPTRREKAARRFAEDLREEILSVLEDAPCFFGIQPVHLVATLGEQRGRSPASLALMEVSVEEELLGDFLEELAVVGIRSEWPLTVPVGDDAEGEAPPDEGGEVPDDRASFAVEGRGSVVDADEEGRHRSG
jgi:hypothetical protein